MHIRKTIFVAAAACLIGPVGFAASPSPPAEDPDRSKGHLSLNADQTARLGIRVAAAEAAHEYLLATLPAVVVPPPNARVAVTATFPGTVVQTLAVEGQSVKRGQPLAVIASREVLVHASALRQAQARHSVASSAAARLAKLGDEGVIARSRVEEAESTLAQTKAEMNAEAQILARVNAKGDDGTYTLTAPIDGVVSMAKIQTGAAIEDMAAPFVVDAPDHYEMEAQIPERLIGTISPGMRVQIPGGAQARVTSVGKVIQPETRSALMKAKIEGTTPVVAGTASTVSVYASAPAGAAVVPKTAVTEIDNAAIVFVKTPNGFDVRAVTKAGTGGEHIVVTSGLKPGESVVVAGVSELKSMAREQ